MTLRIFWQKSVLLLFIFVSSINFAAAQKGSEPHQEKLLNGLRLLMWKEPNAAQTTIRLRIHSGAAFDPQNKEGVMKLLAAAFFPNDSAREFFTEELGGNLDVSTNYDYIQVTASGDSKRVLQMIETIAAAVTSPTIDKETTAKLKAAQMEKVLAMEKDANYIADRAAAQRLFGIFPYGRPSDGTAESLARIDFADLLLAEQRFLTADNATLAINGDIDYDLVYRAARRLFGSWRKSEKLIPPNFTQPAAPDEKPLQMENEFAVGLQTRYATRGLARGDKDFYAAEILAAILQNRLMNHVPNEMLKNISVKQSDFVLPGYFIFSFETSPEFAAPNKNENIIKSLTKTDISAAEFNQAKIKFFENYARTANYEHWLDADTYKFASVKDNMQRVNSVTPDDVNRVLKQLRTQPVVTVFVTKKSEDKTALKSGS